MKFENIKVGDVVFISVDVRCGWHEYESFFVPEKVISVTNTRFKTEKGLEFRKNGVGYGSNNERAYFEGELLFYPAKTVKDQTEEMKLFIHKINKEFAISKLIESIKIPLNSRINNEYLDEMEKQLINIKFIIDSKYGL